MRILFILTQDISSPSGVGRYFPLAKELVKLGHNVFLIALHPDFTRLRTKQQFLSGVDVRYVAPMHVKKSGNIKSYYSPLRLIYQATLATYYLAVSAWKIPVDIVHIAKPHPMNGIAGLLKRIQKNQVYVDCDDDEAGSGVFKKNFQRNIVSWFEKSIPQKADFITTNTHYTEKRLISHGIDPTRITYLSSGVDMDRFQQPDLSTLQALRLKYGLVNKQVIAYIGSLSLSSHPVNLLLNSFGQLLHHRPEAKLLIVGGGDDYNRLQAMANQLGIAGSVVFTGHIAADQVVNYYHLSNLVVDPVFDDCAARGRQPLKLFESWACGVPYVSADVGDRVEILGSPPAGILTAPGDVNSLTKSINQLLGNPLMADEIIALGKKRISQYTWDNLAAQLNSIYIRQLSVKN